MGNVSYLSQSLTSFIAGLSEVMRLVSKTVRNRLKITVSQNYHPAVVLKCTSRAQSGNYEHEPPESRNTVP